jgi:hypothetical protein
MFISKIIRLNCRDVKGITRVLNLSLWLLFDTFHSYKYTMNYASDACINVCLHVNCQLRLSEFNQNWNESANFSNTHKYTSSSTNYSARIKLLYKNYLILDNILIKLYWHNTYRYRLFQMFKVSSLQGWSNFPKIYKTPQISGARRVTWRKIYTEKPHILVASIRNSVAMAD